jgi:galactose mutarotase-like enzyme
MPALGGKVSSLRVGSVELLQAPLKPYALRTRDMDFSASDASGWDECLPSVAACTVATEFGPAIIPDHGDLWRVGWQIQASTPESITLNGACFSLPIELTRSMILAETVSGWRLSVLYTLVNRGSYPVPWAWSAHPLFATQPGDRIVLPSFVSNLRLEGSGGNLLAPDTSGCVGWPLAVLSDSDSDDLSVAKAANSGRGDKLFAGPFTRPISDGWCALERPSFGLRITVRFDVAATPWLGLWLCYGGWPDTTGPRQVCVAIEPTTASVDSLAAAPESRTLAPNETFTWPMEIEIDRIPHRYEDQSE